MAVIKDSQVEIYSQIMWYYNTQSGFVIHCPASHIIERRSKGKGLEEQCKYNYYCGPTKDVMLIQDPVFIKLGAPAAGRRVAGLLKLFLCRRVCVCVCVPAPKTINN